LVTLNFCVSLEESVLKIWFCHLFSWFRILSPKICILNALGIVVLRPWSVSVHPVTHLKRRNYILSSFIVSDLFRAQDSLPYRSTEHLTKLNLCNLSGCIF
jgi:hypothetical protein